MGQTYLFIILGIATIAMPLCYVCESEKSLFIENQSLMAMEWVSVILSGEGAFPRHQCWWRHVRFACRLRASSDANIKWLIALARKLQRCGVLKMTLPNLTFSLVYRSSFLPP